MYCKGCNSLLNEDDSTCPKCGLDNNQELEETTEIYLNKISNPKENNNRNQKNNIRIVITLIFLLAIAIIGLYIFKDKKNPINNNPTTSTTMASKLSIFKFDNLRLKYDKDKYGTSTNTIFLKENNNINIVLKSITVDEYNTLVNSNELLDDKLGEIETKTFAGTNSYSHIFIESDKYYLIEVNYYSADNENIQLELSRIIDSLYRNKK